VIEPPGPGGFVGWLTTHLENALTRAIVMRARARSERVVGVEICRVDVAPSSAPVYARMSERDAVFWVRMNNSSRALAEIDIEDYQRDRW